MYVFLIELRALTGSDFSLLGHIHFNGFPKQDPASNLRYNIPGDVLMCTLGTAIPRFVPYIEGTPPFIFSADPPLPDGQALRCLLTFVVPEREI